MTKFGADLIQAMSEALDHAQDKDVPGVKVHSVDVDAKAIRKKLGLTQDEMDRAGDQPRRLQEMGAREAAEWRRALPCFASWRKSLRPCCEPCQRTCRCIALSRVGAFSTVRTPW